MQRQLGVLATTVAALFSMVPSAILAGSISVAWDPVQQATGYRVYYGTASRQYDSFVDVGASTGAVISGLDDCTTYYASVKAYNQFGESTQYSNEIEGWSRPSVQPALTLALQGSQLVLDVDGANFDGLAEITVDSGALPLDVEGAPLVRFESVDVISCNQIQALVTVEPTAMGFQPAPLGTLPVGLQIVNPDGVFSTGAVELDVQFNPSRADLNRRYERTVDRVDGDDLATLARSWASEFGQDSFHFDCDLDGDTDVDGDDLALLATVFGKCKSGNSWSADACM
jgi:hypothetical protein